MRKYNIRNITCNNRKFRILCGKRLPQFGTDFDKKGTKLAIEEWSMSASEKICENLP